MKEGVKVFDIVVIGSGIVGLSTGLAVVKKYPGYKVAILDKENTIAKHQTGHNSGVIHSGIYYKPGSLKAKLAKQGNEEMIQFCRDHNIDHDLCGKVIVAKNEQELQLLDNLYKRGIDNGLEVELVNIDEIKKIEPYLQGVKGIKVPSTGIVNFKKVAQIFAELFQEYGGELYLHTEVLDFTETKEIISLHTNQGEVKCKKVINCGGLHSDRIAKKSGFLMNMKIIPFRGEYYELKEEKRYLCNHLIYPVPNPNFPFLGVHFTRMIDGRILVGPNAVLGLKREGYQKRDVNVKDMLEIFMFSGFWKVATNNAKEGMKELVRSFRKDIVVREVQSFIPEINKSDLLPAKAGVRAQALLNNGKMVDDFFVIKKGRYVHVCNAPSPAATASISIGKHISNFV